MSVLVYSSSELYERHDLLYETCRLRLSKWLSGVHNLKHSDRFWDFLLHYYLSHQMVVRYYLGHWNNNALNSSPQFPEIFTKFPSANQQDLSRLFVTSLGGECPFLDNFHDLASIGKSVARSPSTAENINSESASIDHAEEVIKKFQRRSPSFFLDLGLYGANHFLEAFDLENWISLPAWNYRVTDDPNFQLRSEISDWDVTDPICDYPGFWTSIALTLPLEFLENFLPLYSRLSRFADEINPMAVASSQLWSISYRILAALLAERNIPVLLNQHGGGYGKDHHLETTVEVRLSDKFYTWGWCRNDNQKIIPFKPTRFDKFLKSINNYALAPKYNFIFGSHRKDLFDLLDNSNADYDSISAIGRYVDSLSSKERKLTFYKCRAQKGISKSKELIVESKLKDIRSVKFNTPIEEIFSCANSVVIEYPNSTTEYESKITSTPYKVLNSDWKEKMNLSVFLPDYLI